MNQAMQVRKQEAVQNAIFDAAIELFSAKGFNETTVDEIAEAAGVSQRSFFRYFPTKADVLGHDIPKSGNALVAAVAGCPPEMAAIDVIRAAVLKGTEFSIKQAWTRQIIEITARNNSARQAHASKMVDLQIRLTEAFAARMKNANRDFLRPHLLARFTMMVHDLTMGAWYFGEAEDSVGALEMVLEQISAVLGHGRLTASPAQRKTSSDTPHLDTATP